MEYTATTSRPYRLGTNLPPMSLIIDMTMLDEICELAKGYKEIILRVDGEMHRYKTADVIEMLRQIEL